MRGKKGVLLSVLLAFAAVGAIVLFGAPKLLAHTSTPDFCSSCHVMEAEYEAWVHTGAHRRIACVDCHLPNQNKAVHYLWKSIDGMKDAVLFYSGKVSDRITVSEHGKEVVQANCVRCHETTVSMIDTGRPCWECHRFLKHRTGGAIETI